MSRVQQITTMQKKHREYTSIIFGILLALFAGRDGLLAKNTNSSFTEQLQNGNIQFSEGLLSVDAQEVRPEELVRELGEKCDIKIVLFGEVFSEIPISVKLNQVPLRQGIMRILKLANIKNYLTHFEKTGTADDRIIELSLIGKKGGERQLTSGAASKRSNPPDKAEEVKTAIQADNETKTEEGQVFKAKIEKEAAAEMQENFLDMMDQILEQQFEEGEEPDPATILKLFKDVVPQEIEQHIPPEVLEELEKLADE